MAIPKKIKDNMESEWEVYYPGMENESFKKNSNNLKKEISPEWEVYYPPEPKETLFESITQAPFRIAGDIGKAASSAWKAAPGYFEKAQTEVPGFLPSLMEHPGHMAGQAIAGLGELGQKTFNFPHKLIEYGSNRLHLLPEKWGQVAQMSEMPESQEQINEIFGKPQYPGEAMLRGTARNLDVVVPSTKLASMLVPSTNKGMAKYIQKSHDTIQNNAISGFKEVSQGAKERNIPNVPIQNSLDISKIERFFPKTEEAKELLNSARIGDYDALRQVQADLFSEGNKSLGSTKSAERRKGAKMHEHRNKINQAISDNLIMTGNYDLNDLLNNSIKDYKTLKNVYYNENLNKSIRNLVDKEKRKIPKNLSTILKEDSKTMNKFKEFHPKLENKMSRYGFQKGLSKVLSKGLIYGGLPALGIGGYEYLKGK